MKNFISFITLLFISFTYCDECVKCVPRGQCEKFGNLNLHEQKAWELKFPCPVPNDKEYGKTFGFAAAAKGDYVCCPTALEAFVINQNADMQQRYYPSNNNNFANQNAYGNGNSGTKPGYNPNEFDYNTNNWVPENTVNNPNYNNNGIDYQNVVGGRPAFNNKGYNPQASLPPYGYQSVIPPTKNDFSTNHSPYVTSSPSFPGGHFGNTVSGEQCPVTSFPPRPETGCCGLEATRDTYRTAVPNAPITRYPQSQPTIPNQFGNPSWMNQGFPHYETRPGRRVVRSADNDNVNITIDDRITGGRETEFEQFPWTALLRTTFDYGNQKATFDCGSSLISSRYVLTAGHCVFDNDGKLINVEVFLAEYDKRTFPKDCKLILGHGEKCIENVVMEGEDVILHPKYDDSQLINDIALIRLRGNAPYTDYIRPICLPSIDIDTPNFSNLRLAVAGWGRNKRNRSNIKQSTVVQLVPQEKCTKFYPTLTRRQVCAAGYNGEDTCKGDSGGPLMTVYNGKYEVVGVVSGKRADSPCGTAVPSLYTNVYHYLDWIHSNIRN